MRPWSRSATTIRSCRVIARRRRRQAARLRGRIPARQVRRMCAEPGSRRSDSSQPVRTCCAVGPWAGNPVASSVPVCSGASSAEPWRSPTNTMAPRYGGLIARRFLRCGTSGAACVAPPRLAPAVRTSSDPAAARAGVERWPVGAGATAPARAFAPPGYCSIGRQADVLAQDHSNELTFGRNSLQRCPRNECFHSKVLLGLIRKGA